jgi:hypothetical protein
MADSFSLTGVATWKLLFAKFSDPGILAMLDLLLRTGYRYGGMWSKQFSTSDGAEVLILCKFEVVGISSLRYSPSHPLPSSAHWDQSSQFYNSLLKLDSRVCDITRNCTVPGTLFCVRGRQRRMGIMMIHSPSFVNTSLEERVLAPRTKNVFL